MISLITKQLHFKAALLLASLALPQAAQAAAINGTLTGDKLTWFNVQHQGEYLTTSNWRPVSGLMPTSEWIPGTFIGTPPAMLTMHNVESGETLQLDFTVAGLQYNLGSAAGSFSETGSTPSGYRVCDTALSQGAVATLVSRESRGICLGATSYLSDSGAAAPFQFVRPVIRAADIAAAFREAKVSSGRYSGTVLVQPAYGFRSPTGSWTYRNALAVPVTLNLRYEAASLVSLDISGNGVMDAEYDPANMTASGSAQYTITANGYFNDGLKLTFPGQDFQLRYAGEKDTGVKDIPYSIDCNGCDDQQIVKQGLLNLNSGQTVVPGEGNTLKFIFDVHYDDISADNLQTGNYYDQFTVYFEENL